MKLSVIVPVFNEKDTIEEIVRRIQRVNINKEIVLVDDCSGDGTREKLKNLEGKELKIIYHTRNQGKGAAIRTGIGEATGDLIIIQDADLEYSPEEYTRLIKPVLENGAGVVYGSRFLGKRPEMLALFYAGNRFLTFITNVLYHSSLTDMETCYKLFKADLIKSIKLNSRRFDFEPEITAKVLKSGYNIVEVPISYESRGKRAGKKITWRDGIAALWCLIKYRFVD